MRTIALEYHDVVDNGDFDSSGFPGPAANSYKLGLADFEAHLAALGGNRGAHGDVRTGLVSSGPAAVLLTFDDGGVSAAGPIADALDRRALVGHFFMTTGRIGTAGFCSAQQLRELVARGHVVGSHSHSHPVRMATLTNSELLEEWRTSAARLADVLGSAPTVASVPGGYYEPRIAHAAAEAGYAWLFTSEPVTRVAEVAGCRVMGRFTLRRHSPAAEVASLVGPSGVGRARQWVVWNTKKVVKRVGGRGYLGVREWIFRRGNSRPE